MLFFTWIRHLLLCPNMHFFLSSTTISVVTTPWNSQLLSLRWNQWHSRAAEVALTLDRAIGTVCLCDHVLLSKPVRAKEMPFWWVTSWGHGPALGLMGLLPPWARGWSLPRRGEASKCVLVTVPGTRPGRSWQGHTPGMLAFVSHYIPLLLTPAVVRISVICNQESSWIQVTTDSTPCGPNSFFNRFLLKWLY